MIKHTIYFRTQEDKDKFLAIPNKTEWLHEHLSVMAKPDIPTMTVKAMGRDVDIVHPDYIKDLTEPTYTTDESQTDE